ncbi:hypothetical protein DFH06DRAFT_1333925 [Mycena polygramma]|nr:hypothetical protein DFH06DRAFT_1333925 [Mycena polygramma]
MCYLPPLDSVLSRSQSFGSATCGPNTTLAFLCPLTATNFDLCYSIVPGIRIAGALAWSTPAATPFAAAWLGPLKGRLTNGTFTKNMDSSQENPSTDNSVPRDPTAVYGERNESGLYDTIADQIQGMGKDALANVDYPDDFTRRIEDWSKNHRFVDKAGNELRIAVVGEILGPAMGTIVRAHGNYFARDGDDFKPIDDKSKIKDTIAIGIPTQSTVKLLNIFLNQVIALGQVTEASADEDARNGRTPFVKNWTKPGKEGSENHDVIMMSMLPKYAVPSAAGAPKVKRTAKRKLDEVDTDAGPSTKPEADKAAEPSPEDIKLGAHYEPTLLQDYGGSYFNHIKSKLVQLDVRDTQNNLIPPWKFYDALKPGTLVLALVSLHCFTMNDESGKDVKQRKIYQVNAHSIRVLSDSEELVEERTRPIAPNSTERVTSKLPERAVASSFSNFIVPHVAATPGSPHSTLSGEEVATEEMTGVEETGKRRGKRVKRD